MPEMLWQSSLPGPMSNSIKARRLCNLIVRFIVCKAPASRGYADGFPPSTRLGTATVIRGWRMVPSTPADPGSAGKRRLPPPVEQHTAGSPRLIAPRRQHQRDPMEVFNGDLGSNLEAIGQAPTGSPQAIAKGESSIGIAGVGHETIQQHEKSRRSRYLR